MKNIVLFQKGETPFVTFIKRRLKKHLNFVCLFTGSLGIGKTYNGIRLAYDLDNNFDASKQITFDFEQTMGLINSDWFKALKIKVIVWDEPQISISNRAWQSQMNKLVNYLMSTFRHLGIVLIFCAPYIDFLDSQSMKLLHCNFKCLGINRREKLSKVRPYLLDWSSEMQKFYRHSLYCIHQKPIGVKKISFWDIRKPPKHLINIYEPKKVEFTTKLNKNIEITLDKMKVKDKTEIEEEPLWLRGKTHPSDVGLIVLGEWMEGEFNSDKIAEKHNTKGANIRSALKALRKQGHKREMYQKQWEMKKIEENKV